MNQPLSSLSPPESWVTVPLGHLVARSKESARPDLPPLSVFLDQGVVPRNSRDDNFNRLGADLGRYLIVRPGDLVFNKLRTWQGGLGVSSHYGIVSPAYFVCRPIDGVEPRFLHYLLRSRVYLEELTRLSKWMPPSQFDIAWNDLKKVPVLLPELVDQRKIADFLDTETTRIDALIAKKRRLAELAKIRHETWLRAQLEGVAPMIPLKRRWRVVDCKHRTPTYVDEGIPVVSPGDIAPGRLDLTRPHRFVDESDFRDLTEGGRLASRGDIIYSRNASIGIAAYVDTVQPFTMGQDVCLITSLDQDQLYLTYVLNSVGSDQLEAEKLGTTFSRINVAQILELRVPAPPVSTQRRLAREFDAATRTVGRLVGALARQIELLTEHRQALITAAVTGELDVAESIAEEAS